MPIKQSNIDKYIATGGNSCLNCGSEDISGGYIEIEFSHAFQKITCSECGYSWTDEYTLTSVSNIEDIEGNTVTVEEE